MLFSSNLVINFTNKFVRRISTIKGELIPYLVKKQFSVTSKDIKKCNDFEVEDTPNPKSNIQNGEPGRKSKYQTNLKFVPKSASIINPNTV